MARMQGITGKLSGKMGAAVFRVREGQQIVTQYNPIVKNPNTEFQQSQRAKFKLMSQLSAIMAPGMGTMGVINRPARGKVTNRNGFVQKNFGLVETTEENGTITAKVAMEQLQLTNSFKYLPAIAATAAEGEINVAMSSIPSEVTTIRLVVVGYSVESNASQANIQQLMDIPVENGSIQQSLNVTSGNYTILAYGLIPSESAKSRIDLDNIHTPADEDFISAVKLNAMVADGSMSMTKTVGANVTINA